MTTMVANTKVEDGPPKSPEGAKGRSPD
jgi:hypothetical protein